MARGRLRRADDSDDDSPDAGAAEGDSKEPGEKVAQARGGRRRFSGESDKDSDTIEGDASKPSTAGRARIRKTEEDDDDDDETNEATDWRERKKRQEEEERRKARAEEEIEAAPTPIPEQPETPGISRKEKRKTRFDKEGQDADGEEHREPEPVELYVPNPEEIPFTTKEYRKQREEETLFRIGEKGKNALMEARDGMREQGLYVARDRVLLPSNIERAIQRVRHRKLAIKERQEKRDKNKATTATAEGAQENEPADEESTETAAPKASKPPIVDQRTGMEFEADEEPYLIPFDPLKDRICRPSMRYDPSLPYMQYDMVVPVTNIDAVLGSPDSSVLLELEITRLDLTDHPLFCKEDQMAVELTSLARKYQRRAEINWVDFYSQKLEALLAALETVQRERELVKEAGGRPLPLAQAGKKGSKRVLEALVGHGGAVEKLMQEQYLQDEVRNLRLLRAQEEFEDLSIVSRMIEVWERIKQVREEQKFISTRVDLKFREKKTSAQQDEQDRDEELKAELQEMRKRQNAAFAGMQAKFLKDKATLEEKVETLTRRIADLEEKETQARVGEPADDDDDDDDEDDDDDDDAYVYSPDKRGRNKATKPSDGKIAKQLQLQKESEKETLHKTEELLEKLKQKEPKEKDHQFDAEAARKEIEDRQNRLKRPPGDPIYIPIFNDNKPRKDTPESEGPKAKAEKRRREKIRALQLLLKVEVNGRLLRKPDGRVLEVPLLPRPGFDFSFQARETIQLAPTSGLPEIRIHVCEGGLMHTEIGSLFVPVVEEGRDDRGDPLVFHAEKPFEVDTTVVAVAKTLKHADSDEKVVLPTGDHYITGEIFLRLNHTATGPAVRADGSVAINIDGPVTDQAGQVGGAERDKQRGGMVSSAKLKKMIQMNQLDPNDPRNRHLLDLLSSNKEAESETYVRFDSLVDTVLMGDSIQLSHRDHSVISNRWIGEQDLTRPAGMRHKLLLARDKNPSGFGGEWPDNAIPLFDKEIDQDEVRSDQFYQTVYAVEFPEDDDDSGQRAVDNKQVKKLLQFKQKVQEVVRKHKAKQGARMRRVYRLEDVVHQPELPEFGAPDIIAAIKHFFRKRSALRPEEKPVKVTSANPSECRISITVQRAQNLPQRRPEIPMPGQPGYSQNAAPPQTGAQAEQGLPLECVVQARFGKSVETTPVFKGNNPAWNAHLNLKFEPPNKSWSPSNLMKVTDSLHLNIFDTKVWKKPDTDGQLTKLEKRWLGSIRFPFTTLYTASAKGRIEGIFEIEAPPHIIGYTTAHNAHTAATQGGKSTTAGNQSGTTVPGTSHLRSTLQVCVALDPPLAQPSQRERELKGRLHAQPELDLRVREWIAECSKPNHCKDRTYDALGRSLNRDWVLATRFITPQAPPELDETESAKDDRKMAQLCRYVSLIPFLEDFHLEDAGGDEIDHDGMDVWCTSSEFLHFMAGDWEEHATLLCNFFLHLKKAAYLVFGSGIPEGDTVYVMTVEREPSSSEDQVWFWNASKGCKYNSKDDKCTLKEVYYIVNNENVWGNIQATRDLTLTHFNLRDLKCWKPLFNEKYPASKYLTESVQEKIDWKLNQKNETYVRDIQKDISLTIRNRLEHWRSREGKNLVENEAANRTLTDILKAMEKSSHNGTVFTEEDHHEKLQKYLQPGSTGGYNMTGFYINRPFTDPQQIIDEIENADVHHAGPVVVESDVQYGIAVHVKAFPRRVLSLWVAVACLSRKT